MHNRITILIVGCALLWASLAFAAPTKLSQQGRLTDADGSSLTGAHGMTFSLHDAESDGAELWREERVIDFEEGYYSVVLGTLVPLDDLMFADGPVWLELAVDNIVLIPRQEVVSVPYALRAAVAESVEGGTVEASEVTVDGALDAAEVSVDGSVVIDGDGDWVGTPPDWSELTGVPSDLADGDADTDTLLGLPCADGYIAKYSDLLGAWDCAPDLDTQLTETQVDAFVANNGYSSGDHTVDTNTDTLTTLSCTDGQVAAWSAQNNAWFCLDLPQFTDSDADGIIDSVDCQPGNAAISQLADEICDGEDNDCDGLIDDNDPDVTGITWYGDNDGDGAAGSVISQTACTQPTGFFANATDCDDSDDSNVPGGTESCDGEDNDCIGGADFVTTVGDGGGESDGDGDGVLDCADCVDGDSAVFPGATESCDGSDNDCDGATDEDFDVDNDGVTSCGADGDAGGAGAADDDCDDTDPTRYPSNAETCDGVDNDCDGSELANGSGASCPSSSCNQILTDNPGSSDDRYWIDPTSTGAFQVTCDMTGDGGGWTLVAVNGNNQSQVMTAGSMGQEAQIVRADPGSDAIHKFSDTRINQIKSENGNAIGIRIVYEAISNLKKFGRAGCTWESNSMDPSDNDCDYATGSYSSSPSWSHSPNFWFSGGLPSWSSGSCPSWQRMGIYSSNYSSGYSKYHVGACGLDSWGTLWVK